MVVPGGEEVVELGFGGHSSIMRQFAQWVALTSTVEFT